MANEYITLPTWSRAWREVAMQLARDVLRAESPEEALEAWRTARVLGEARDMLASAIAGDDDELRQQLAPLTPLEELDHGRR